MGTTSSINPGLANLLQRLSDVDSPLVSSPQAVAALQKASPADIVQLSAEATQLQTFNALLGSADATSPSTTAFDPFASLEAAATAAISGTGAAPSAAASATTPSLAAAIASYEGSAQSNEMAALFGTDTTAGSTGGTSFLG
jgi:hypothetical protein